MDYELRLQHDVRAVSEASLKRQLDIAYNYDFKIEIKVLEDELYRRNFWQKQLENNNAH